MYLPILLLFASATGSLVPVKHPTRSGKFLGFSADDMLMDIFDDADYPLPSPKKAKKVEEKSQHFRFDETFTINSTVKKDKTKTSLPPPSSISPTTLTSTSTSTSTPRTTITTTTTELPQTFEYVVNSSSNYSFTPKPISQNSIIIYEKDHYHFNASSDVKPIWNNTQIKIFWNSVEDAVESIPFLPIQINVPDMVSAMTSFFANYLPFLNRLTNPNHPRVPYPTPLKNRTNVELSNSYKTYDFDQAPDLPILRRRQYYEEPFTVSKKRRKNKRKTNKKKNVTNPSGKKIFEIPTLSRTTTAPPPEDSKLWSLGSDQKETLKLKNMPITRKKIRVADREVFNFKNSDISNSPIMILNVPQRPITHYKIIHQGTQEKESRQGSKYTQNKPANQFFQEQPSSSEKLPTKQRRKLRNDNKKRSSKRSGRLESNLSVQESSTSSAP